MELAMTSDRKISNGDASARRRRGGSAGARRVELPDMSTWPVSWMGMPADLHAGRELVAYFRPFLQDLQRRGLSRKTVRTHAQNLWVLGSEIIRHLNLPSSEATRSVRRVLEDAVQDGGLLPRHLDSPTDLRSFEATCRKLERHLAGHPESSD
jgi:hypothetical protein